MSDCELGLEAQFVKVRVSVFVRVRGFVKVRVRVGLG